MSWAQEVSLGNTGEQKERERKRREEGRRNFPGHRNKTICLACQKSFKQEGYYIPFNISLKAKTYFLTDLE